MARRTAVQIPEYELDDLFSALRIWDGLDNHSLTEIRSPDPPEPAKMCALNGSTSFYSRVTLQFDSGSNVQARIHYTDCLFGGIIGRWTSVLKIGDVTLYRRGHQRRPENP